MAWVNLLDIVYPVGAVYFSISPTSPADLIGGTWNQLTGGLLGLADSANIADAGADGGSNTITESQLPSHRHTLTTNGGHQHQTAYSVTGVRNGSYWQPVTLSASGRDGTTIEYTNTAGSHTHTVGLTGDDEPFVPAHSSVYGWKRIA